MKEIIIYLHLSAAARLVIKDMIMLVASIVTMAHAAKKYLERQQTLTYSI